MKKMFSLLAVTAFITAAQAQFRFNKVDHMGAIGSHDWTHGWTNFDPDNANYATTNATLSGEITGDMTLDASKVYKLEGFVYVRNGATLTIPAGTVIRGDKATKGTLVITRGSKIMAKGTKDQPVIFTSNEAAGDRDYGDWGGLIILGAAPVNPSGGTATIEGGVNNANNDGAYGGSNLSDNSGSLTYVRVEFPGIAYQPNNEINGLTLGGVGAGTKIEYLQVSYSGDDAIEWFGGNVNAKFLVAHRTWDDDFDCDFGYSGNVQFGIVLRDPNIADVSASNSFEVDNDGTGSDNTPLTSATFSNITVIGPIAFGTPDGNYRRALHLRRNSKLKIYNSVFAGYPTGLLLDGTKTTTAFQNGEAKFRCNAIVACPKPLDTAGTGASMPSFDITGWYNTAGFNNSLIANLGDAKFTTLSLTSPNLMPQAGSPLRTLDAGCLTDLGTLDPALSKIKHEKTNLGMELYPNPATEETTIGFTLENETAVKITITDIRGIMSQIIAEGGYSAGSHHIEASTASLVSGIYLVRIETPAGYQTLKLNVVK